MSDHVAGDAFFVDCVSRIDGLCAQWFPTRRRLQIAQPYTTFVRPREMGTGSVLALVAVAFFAALVVVALVLRMWR